MRALDLWRTNQDLAHEALKRKRLLSVVAKLNGEYSHRGGELGQISMKFKAFAQR